VPPAAFQAAILDNLGYVQQGREEMEVLFTFLAEALRYFSQLHGNHVEWRYMRQLAVRMALDLSVAIKNLSRRN